MIFKRSGLSYGRSEAPVTPYQKAAQVWDERLGSARVQARNWRFMAFGALGIFLGPVLLALGIAMAEEFAGQPRGAWRQP